ncbi:carcinoembryonic antigen-related cell adhesion molecule 16-like [Sarcophilus harrisii]|uniref:carcinoembryonic antigen-related cell adhesion molecule 16-like n=1 Tax=Sarcophilus harrisii TaxID=9305 RepID=UPI001301EB16|nr:carcinoembryonic antigen-related cell adhesion molecule 16-like [Sarcophilus harrisii]
MESPSEPQSGVFNPWRVLLITGQDSLQTPPLSSQQPPPLFQGQLSGLGLSGGQRDPADLCLLPPLSASILSCWIQPTSTQFSLLPNPLYGEVNRSITLDIQGFSGQALIYTWYRKAVAEPNKIALYRVETEAQEPAGIREKVLPNGSLLIPDLTLSDTDDYHVTIVNSQGSIMVGQGHLTVYGKCCPSPGPCLTPIPSLSLG